MIPRPPKPTLFPYTTLFRSSPDTPLTKVMNPNVLRVEADVPKEEVASLIAKYDLLALPVVDARRTLLGTVTVDDVVELMMPRDRKSTRLNSSHQIISYAVFC